MAGRPSSPIRSLRPLPSTLISPRRRSTRAHVRGGKLADAQPRRVGRLHDRRIALGQGDGQLAAGPAGHGRVGGLLVDRREQSFDVLGLEDPRQAARQAGGGDGAPRVAGGKALARRPPVERPDRRQPLGDRRAGRAGTKVGEIGAQVEPGRSAPVDAALGQPVEVGADGRGVGASRLGRRVPGLEGLEEALERRMGRRVTRDRRHASGAGSAGWVRRPLPRPPVVRRVGARPARAGRARALGSAGPPA